MVLSTASLQVQARALGDPTRYKIFRYIVDAPGLVGVAELTDLLGLNHNAIRQHLAQLVAAELVLESTVPQTGRGRPRLGYRPNPGIDERWGVIGPFERLSLWLTEIVRTGDTPFDVGLRVGRRSRLGGDPVNDPQSAFVEQLAAGGYAPAATITGDRADVTLTNCPFASAALADPDTICELHRGITTGIAEAIGGIAVEGLTPRDPRESNCRLAVRIDAPVAVAH